MIQWIRKEWGILGAADKLRWLRQWIPFGGRTLGYGMVSLVGGPFTRGEASMWAARKWSEVSTRKLGIDIDARGTEHIPDGALVYACNHQSLIDILVLGATLPQDYRWAAKRSLMNIPVLGWHLRLAGHVPVDRQAGRDSAQAVSAAFASVLERQQRLLVFPEGTRSVDGKLKPFKAGAFYAAVKAGTPVVPIAVEGTFSILSRHDADMDEHAHRRVWIRIAAPITADLAIPEAEQVDDLRRRAQGLVEAMLEEIRIEAERAAEAREGQAGAH